LWTNQANSRRYLVSATGKQAQHTGSIGSVAGFAQNFRVYDDDRIGAKNKVIRTLAKHG
jgi:hypothetical protein